MNLENFEQHINETILDRGHGYYMEDLAEQTDCIDGEYRFQVSGSDVYEVIVTLDAAGEILSSYCDCPYTYGPVCKHEAAVYFELADLLDSAVPNKDKQEALADVLDQLSKNQLIELIEDLARQDDHVKNRILVKYSKLDAAQERQRFAEWIHLIVHRNQGRRGFIEYGETSRFVRELDECLVEVGECADEVLALDLAFLLLNEAVNAFQYADDSDGDIGMLADEVAELIEKIVVEALETGSAQRQMLFDKLLLQCDHPVYKDWEEYRADLLRIGIHFTDDREYREALQNKIRALIEKTGPDRSLRYYYEGLHRLLYEIIERNGSAKEVVQFLEEYHYISSFRELLLEKYLENKEYRRAIQLASAGEQADQEFAGLVTKWKKFRYAGYKGLSLREEQAVLAKELFLDGDFDFYQELKMLSADPKQSYEQLKQELKAKGNWRSKGLYRQLIEEEHDTAELLEFVRENPEAVETYAKDLIELHENEILKIYKEYIHGIANRSSNRKGYQHVCGIIWRYGKLAGKQMELAVVDELRNRFARKPAFMDELGKFL
ncbi:MULTISPECIES: SWIM zinc finger domain-containing protein [unclassified Sporosarcina]|uniref:SWIM zinc finger family protein n=1 Tax=unclassified Sporosarcina TaxID=2647733 RepID=UPI002042434E|nr:MULTISPECIES: hypothetical protein [unclassified Sporosarcina]GKV64821.1 hypothetical protein NCCP2331_09740 [Sporosarcina sp. NCCP-2331]GLB54931.1 hypothetical protein NCCP2378_07160 [Sporosarcina sp. NCCP-2378]